MPNLPNFLIFCVDQMQACALGANGNRDVQMPVLDRLAAEGVSFRRAYCPNSVCQPSRASMFTGLTPRQHGLVTNGGRLAADVPTIGGALVSAGYRTHSVGKLHLQPYINEDRPACTGGEIDSWESEFRWRHGEVTKLPPDYYGFQTSDFLGGHGYYVCGEYMPWLHARHPDPASLHIAGNLKGRFHGDAVGELPPELHYNHWIGERAIDFLDRQAADDAPFFLWCSFPDPHHPFLAAKAYRDRYDAQALSINPTWRNTAETCPYLHHHHRPGQPALDEDRLREVTAQTYGMISHIDENVGRVLDALERKGLADNTIVLFVSDHGEYLGSHGLLHKSVWHYEELVRVPFIWRVPGASPAASSSVVSLLDIVPTILDFAGLDATVLDPRSYGRGGSRRFLPGRSLRRHLERGEPLPERPAVCEYTEYLAAGPRTLVEQQWKLTVYPPDGGGMLFDLDADPYESVNLWDVPAAAKERNRMIHRLLETMAMTDRHDAVLLGTS